MIKVCGCNNSFQLGEKSNNRSPNGFFAINPSVKSRLDPSTITSISIYSDHLVFITKDGIAHCIGDNSDFRISGSLPKKVLEQITDIHIKDKEGRSYTPISAVCGEAYTLFLVYDPSSPNVRKLAYSYVFPKDDFPLFLNLSNFSPVSLFGGRWDSAAIDAEGAIIFIPESVPENPDSPVERVFLPNNKKAASIVCLSESVFALSSDGRVFSASLPESESSSSVRLVFEAVSELSEVNVKAISGGYNHVLAVADDGRVFGAGSNKYGKIGAPQESGEDLKKFVLLEALKKFVIVQAVAGNTHSLFLTEEGKVLACGTNEFGQLMLGAEQGACVLAPVETTVSGGARFCVAGDGVSLVFVDCEAPANSPNRTISSFSNE